MGVEVTFGSSPLNVPLINTGGIPGFLDTTLLGVETGSTAGNISLLDTGAVAGKLDTTLLGVSRTPATATTTAGTTAGSIIDHETINFEGGGKTNVIEVSGYENDTVTNQVITFATAYSTFNFVTANTSGLTITLSLTGITITAPDSTTTYTGGIMIAGL